METLVSKNDILAYLPQQPPFTMVDELVAFDETSAKSQFLVETDNVLVRNGLFGESGLVENMAQTIALYAGYKARAANEKPPIGYIAGIKNLEISARAQTGTTLITEVEIVNEVLNMQIANAKVSDASGKLLANCELRIFITE